MLPTLRSDEHLFSVPKFDLVAEDVRGFLHELREFHAMFADCFQRSESREHFYRYMAGQIGPLERKTIEPIAMATEGGNIRTIQRFVSDAPWDEEKMIAKYRSLVSLDFGNPNAALVFDESSFVKKGKESIGVARQYCGTLGKVENCQLGVFTAYVSESGYALVDKRIFIPEKWFSDDYHDRRKKCNLPDEVVFRTKPELAAEMLKAISKENELPFKYILADTVYGVSPEFISAAEALQDKTYFVSIPKDTQCWLRQPMTITKEYQWRGKTRKKTMLSDPKGKPLSVSTLAKNTSDFFWYRRQVSEGAKGPIVYEFTRRKVILASSGLPQKTVWLLIKRTIGSDQEYSYYISNASRSTSLRTLVWLSGLRWAIEQCFEETKTELGMDHYEIRKYPGWHHHILTCMLAHYFLWHLKIRLGKKSTIYYVVAA